MADALAPKPDRNLAIDAVKGIGILQVVVHHVLGQAARTYSTRGDKHWLLMRAIAWATNFAIPLFLLLSAMLLAGSLLKQPSAPRFVWRRASRTLWPYAVWTIIYWLLRWWNDPHTFDKPAKLATEFLSGKAGYHLYFMVILIQLSIAVPFVVAALRKRTLGFGAILGISLALQLAFFLLNRVPALRITSPGSSLTWYVAPLLLGAWMALNRDAWTEAWKRWWPMFTLVAVLSGAAFTYLSIQNELKLPIDSLVWNSLSVLFRVGATLALLGAATLLARLPIGPFLAALGRYSLPIYLVHPALLRLLGGPTVSKAFGMLPAPALWLFLVVAGLSFGFAWLTRVCGLDLPLFGQKLPRPSNT